MPPSELVAVVGLCLMASFLSGLACAVWLLRSRIDMLETSLREARRLGVRR